MLSSVCSAGCCLVRRPKEVRHWPHSGTRSTNAPQSQHPEARSLQHCDSQGSVAVRLDAQHQGSGQRHTGRGGVLQIECGGADQGNYDAIFFGVRANSSRAKAPNYCHARARSVSTHTHQVFGLDDIVKDVPFGFLWLPEPKLILSHEAGKAARRLLQERSTASSDYTRRVRRFKSRTKENPPETDPRLIPISCTFPRPLEDIIKYLAHRVGSTSKLLQMTSREISQVTCKQSKNSHIMLLPSSLHEILHHACATSLSRFCSARGGLATSTRSASSKHRWSEARLFLALEQSALLATHLCLVEERRTLFHPACACQERSIMRTSMLASELLLFERK